MRDSCKITTGGSKSENKKVFGGAGIPYLKEVESGRPVVNTARKHGVSPATIHRRKSKYGGMTLSELKRLKALEKENARLKRIVAQQALDNELLREST
jgi:putative transposase